jgi:hypothetical protein
VLANVGVPETVIVPSPALAPLIVPTIVFPVPENVTDAVPVLSSKVIAVANTVFAKFPNEFSPETSPPTTLIFVPATVPSNFASYSYCICFNVA